MRRLLLDLIWCDVYSVARIIWEMTDSLADDIPLWWCLRLNWFQEHLFITRARLRFVRLLDRLLRRLIRRKRLKWGGSLIFFHGSILWILGQCFLHRKKAEEPILRWKLIWIINRILQLVVFYRKFPSGTTYVFRFEPLTFRSPI